MGDFTSRCAISGIPLWGRDVVAVGLSVAYDNTLRCGAITVTDMYHVASLPIRGRHNGYGFIDRISNPHSERVSCEAWSDDPQSNLESVFREWPEVERIDYFEKQVKYKLTFALIDAQVWAWLLENSEAKKAELLEAYKSEFLPKLEKIRQQNAQTLADLAPAIAEGKCKAPTVENDIRWAFRNYDWRVKDSFGQFMRCMDSFEVLSHPFCHRAMKAFIDQDMEVVEGLIELFVVTMALRDIDKFWQPSSTCGDQYGDITKVKIKFAQFNLKNFKDMAKEQKRLQKED
jgi:hypothetical protein